MCLLALAVLAARAVTASAGPSNAPLTPFTISTAQAPPTPGPAAPDARVIVQSAPELRAPGRQGAGPDVGISSLDWIWTWYFMPGIAGYGLGALVATAGDVNADGFSDFLAIGGAGKDRLYLYLGTAGFPQLAPGFPITLPFNSATSATGCGDVNGDGYGDIVLGWTSSNRIRVYYGQASGLDLTNPFDYRLGFADWGGTVRPAGDVNGDGYDELIVTTSSNGTQLECGPGTPSYGRVDVIYGSSTGPKTSNMWTFSGCPTPWPNSYGASAATAGDVNADGYDDIVIGLPLYPSTNVGGLIGGRVYVVFGSATGLPSGPGYMAGASIVDSPVAFADFGKAVCPAGDVNGDGYADVAVGAPFDNTYANAGGVARVYAGSAGGLTSNVLWSEGNPDPFSEFGRYLAPAGDVNGDGRGDLIVGQSTNAVFAQSEQSTLVIRGALAASPVTAANTVGDINGDGFSDVIVGDAGYTNSANGEGRITVFMGMGDGPSTSPSWSITQLAVIDPNVGWSVSSAGDVNGDGLDDVLVGGPNWDDFVHGGTDNGVVYLALGGFSGLPASVSWFHFGSPGDLEGSAVASIGDVNGDGFGDFAIGAPQSGTGAGQVLVFHGRNGAVPLSTPTRVLTGSSVGGQFGASITGGDFNGDGYADIAVGAPLDALVGSVTVYTGSPTGLSASPAWVGYGGMRGELYGTSINGFTDTNGDGYTELAVGSPGYDVPIPPASLVDAGRITVYRGGRLGDFLAFVTTMDGQANEQFGYCVSNAGDVNGDGYGDLIVGAPTANVTISQQGRAVVVSGSYAWLGSAMWSQLGEVSGGGFGTSVAGAGDVNGDGMSDVVVGAPFESGGGPAQRGVVRIYPGPLMAIVPPIWTATGAGLTANMGQSIANAGDVNGDGWPDLVFGEPGYQDIGYPQGLAQVYLGGHAGSRIHFASPLRTLSGPPIAPMGSAAAGSPPILVSYAASAAGRTKFKMQWDAQLTKAFPPHVIAGSANTWASTDLAGGGLGALGLGLTPLPGLYTGAPYAWRLRARFRNLYFPTSPWMSPARSGRREYDLRGAGTTWADVDAPASITRVALSEAQPNPMRGGTTLHFELPVRARVTLDVVDVQGRHVRTLADGEHGAGRHAATWDGRDAAGASAPVGVYFVRLRAGGESCSRKLVRME